MDILTDKTLKLENVVVHSDKFNERSYQKALIDIFSNFKSYIKNNENYLITTTKSLLIENGEQVVDAEIMLQVDQEIEVNNPYIFKKELIISNALYMKIYSAAKLPYALMELNTYAKKNKLEFKTSAYIVQHKSENTEIIEIYIGL